MTTLRKPLLGLCVLVLALLAVQHFGLERAVEKHHEDRFSRDAMIGASKALPQYAAALFMGAFRAVIVDVLWVEQSRIGEEDHRFFEVVEIMDMISALQPRNPEVWVHQAWNATHNIANHVRRPEEKWKWIRYGLTKLKEGAMQLPEDPYLKEEVAWTLIQKSTWRDGYFDEPHTSAVMRDRELQKDLWREPISESTRALLAHGLTRGTPLTCFELAIPWLEGALEDLRVMKETQRWKYDLATRGGDPERDYHTTQVGRNIHPSSVDMQIYLAEYYNAFFYWRQGKKVEALTWFRAAAAHARYLNDRYHISPIHKQYAALCDALAQAVQRPVESPEDRLRLLGELTTLIKGNSTDFRYVVRDLTILKQALGGDEFEFNDSEDYMAQVELERVQAATLWPPGDTDWYYGWVSDPKERSGAHVHEEAHDPAPFPPHRVGFQVKKEGDMPLRITLMTYQGGAWKVAQTRDIQGRRWEEVEGITDRAGQFALLVEPLDSTQGGQNPSYFVRWSLARPVSMK